MHHQETVIEIPHLKMGAKIWGDPHKLPVIALHGWLDNAGSFDRLAPLLSDIHLIAIDLPGHGHSDHKPHGSFIHFIDFVIDIILAAHHLKLKKFALLGHSLGAAVASFIAGTIPEQILGIALIDGLGPLTTPAQEAPARLKAFTEAISDKPIKNAPLYDERKRAVAARLKGGPLSTEAAEALVNRGLKKVNDHQWTWRTDPRLLIPTALQLTEEQVLAFLDHITAPVLIIRPDQGYPFPLDLIQGRLNALKDVTVQDIKGHHHVHLDDPQSTAQCLAPFFATLNFGKEKNA